MMRVLTYEWLFDRFMPAMLLIAGTCAATILVTVTILIVTLVVGRL